MQNFLVSFNVVFPIFVMMALGYFIKTIKLISSDTIRQMNSVIFKVFLPLMIFKNVYESSISDVFSVKLALFVIICIFVIIALLFIIIPLIEKDRKKRGVLIQAIFRSNFVIFGVPVSEALCGGENSGTSALLVAIVIPIFNFMAVVTLEVFKGSKPKPTTVIKGIITNPLIIASIVGLIVLFSGIKFPIIIEKTISSISSVTTPMALIMLGASINLNFISKNVKELVLGVLAKLVLIPAIVLPIAIFVMGFVGSDLAVLLAIFATPAAVSSFTMAQQMGADDELAGQLVMFGTVLCVITMFLWIFIIKTFGFI
ncbi:MAG: AEC family transporter [Clostridia bacterium]|nr:AEC family transporter [Clostridia bacterium]